jgi:hypothetical protein
MSESGIGIIVPLCFFSPRIVHRDFSPMLRFAFPSSMFELGDTSCFQICFTRSCPLSMII